MVEVDDRHDDRPPGHLRRRRHGPRPSARSRSRIGHGKRAARHIDAWLRGERSRRRRAAASSRASTRSTPGTTPTRPQTVRRGSTRSAASRTFEEVVRRPRRGQPRCSRRAAACRAATASPATTATASAPTTPSSSSGPGRALRSSTRLLQGLRHLRGGVPLRRDRDGARPGIGNREKHRLTTPTHPAYIRHLMAGSAGAKTW